MTDTQTASTPKPQHLNITKVLFYIVMIGVALQAAYLIINTIYFISRPASMIEFKNIGDSFFARGLLSYIDLSYDTLWFPKEITDGRLYAISANIVNFLAYSLPLILMMSFGRKLLKSFSNSYTPFTLETTAIIKKIGRLMVLMGIFSKLFFQVSMNIINLHEINFANPWELQWLIAGVITLLVADIFKRGCDLQQEVDETL